MVQVPQGHMWVMGDNLGWSRDSRTYGSIPVGLVIGRVVARKEGWVWRWVGNGLEDVEW